MTLLRKRKQSVLYKLYKALQVEEIEIFQSKYKKKLFKEFIVWQIWSLFCAEHRYSRASMNVESSL